MAYTNLGDPMLAIMRRGAEAAQRLAGGQGQLAEGFRYVRGAGFRNTLAMMAIIGTSLRFLVVLPVLAELHLRSAVRAAMRIDSAMASWRSAGGV